MDNGLGSATTVPGEPMLAPPGAEAGTAVPPLAVSGLVVTKAALLAALRLYVPQLRDIEPLDGEGFLLRLAGDAPGDSGSAD